MGFLKKITRPISKVLDKIVPNEIKPALPFLAAAAPFLAPGLVGNTMLSRALVSGGLNLGSQLAQEGSDGDFNPLSVAMASGIGALSAPQVSKTNLASPGDYFRMRSELAGGEGFTNQGLEYLAKSADFLGGGGSGNQAFEGSAADILGKGGTKAGFDMATAKAASIPLTQGTMDLAFAEQTRFNKQQAIDEALAAAEGLADDAARASAIRNAMTTYGFFTDEEIEDTISSAGYRAGGRVGLKGGGTDKMEQYKQYVSDMIKDGETPVDFEDFLKMTDYKTGGRVGLKGGGMDASNPDFGGIPAAIENIQEDAEEMITIMTDNGPIQIEKSVYESMPAMFMDTTTSAYGDAGRGRPVPQFADGGIMNLGGKEMDLRKGGFVPIGKKERADDVPARLSKNEFVMTADAVRAAGGGSVNKGAKRMYDLMNNLEARV
jgi:hypothetical protein